MACLASHFVKCLKPQTFLLDTWVLNFLHNIFNKDKVDLEKI